MNVLSQFLRPAFCVSSRTSSLALAYRPAPYQRLRPAPLTPSVTGALSLDQCLICQALPRNACHEAIKPSQCMVLNITFVQSEGKFVNVAAKMLGASMMIDAISPRLRTAKTLSIPLVVTSSRTRDDILAHAYAQCCSNKGAPGVDGQDFADIEAYGVQRWLGELALALRQETSTGTHQKSVHTEGQRQTQAVGHLHGHIELHFDSVSPWVRLR